jgi:hypothetical protein
MVRFGPGLERRQGFLFRVVDIGLEIFALTATVRRAQKLEQEGAEEAAQAVALADYFARQTQRRIKSLFHDLWRNDDAQAMQIGLEMLDGKHLWIERSIPQLPYEIEDLRPRTMDEIFDERKAKKAKSPAEKPTAREELRSA